jgi:hypothetical protein
MKRNSTKFKPGASGNEAAQWKPGQSGNPAGKSKLRRQFEEEFNQALVTFGSPQEAAALLWDAARQQEPWAVQELCRRYAPEAHALRVVHERDEHEIDYSQFTDEQLDQLQALLAEAQDQPGGPRSRESEEKAA